MSDRSGAGTLWSVSLIIALLCPPVGSAGAAEDPTRTHNLDELAARDGNKPYELLVKDGLYASERTIFHDTVTGAEMWRLTHERANDRHVYYDVPAWNVDGSVMYLLHGGDVGSNQWLVAADCSWMRPADPSGRHFTNPQWSWRDRRWIYYLREGRVERFDWTTGRSVELFDLAGATGIPPRSFRLQPPHPLDDRLLFDSRSSGRFFVLNADGSGFREIPTDGRWATGDAIHRTRWTKSADYQVFLGQNRRLDADGNRIDESVQCLADLDGTLTNCNIGDMDRGGHPDTTVDGEWITGSYRPPKGAINIIHRSGDQKTARRIFYSATDHHSSNTWDGRWHITDNSVPEGGTPIDIRGLTTIDSHVLVSLDGRAQIILHYHYSSYGRDENTHPAPVSSPDGTKIMYDSDMLARGEIKRESTGNADVWIVVVRRPFPARNLTASVRNGEIRLTWQRPLHAEKEIYWHSGNLAREIEGYCVLRAEQSGGPYAQIHDGIVTGTSYTDRSAEPGKAYYYVVQAVEHSGLASLYSNEVCASTSSAAWQGEVRHFYEAEYGQLALLMVPQMEWQDASGGWYVGTFAMAPDPNYPLEPYPAKVAITVNAPKAGGYALWARVRQYGESGAFSVSLDDERARELAAPQGEWGWVRLAGTIELSAGPHEVVLSTMDGSVGLDAICLTDDSGFTPSGLGTWDTEPPAPPEGLTVSRIDATTNRVSWSPSKQRDFHHYNVYCGRDAEYAPTNHRLLLSPTDTEIIDWGIPPGWNTVYKVTAVDRFGNESAPVVLPPQG